MTPTITPTKKQHIAWGYLQDEKTKFIGFGGGAGCVVAGTEVATPNGYRAIESLELGDQVFSYNEQTKGVEPKAVTETFKYGGGEVGQDLIQLTLYDGKTITATPAHRFFVGGDWVSAKSIAKRTLEAYKQKLSNIKQRAIIDEQLEKLREMDDNETSLRWEWISEDNDSEGQTTNSEIAQVGGRGMDTESREQTTSESQELQTSRQQGGEPRVGDIKGELGTLRKKQQDECVYGTTETGCANIQVDEETKKGERTIRSDKRGEDRNFKAKTSASRRNKKEVDSVSGNEGESRKGVRSETSDYSRYRDRKELETSLIVSVDFVEPQNVYDIEVADNNSYLITENNYITHNSGKSWLICEWALTNAYFYPGSRGFIARNELKRLMNSTFITWTKVCKHHQIPETDWVLDGKYNVIRFENGSTIDLLDIAYKPTDPEYERFGSTEYTYGAIEEAGETHFKAFDVLKSRVGRHNVFDGKEVPPKILCTFNPSRGWVYRIFYKPWKLDQLHEAYAFVQALYKDNPHTAKEYGAQLSEIVDRTTRERLMKGNWEYEEEHGLLMRYANIRDLFTNTVVKDTEKYLSVDVARFGSDKVVLNFWEGLESYKREYYEKQGIDKTIQLIRDAAAEHKIPFSHIVIDDDGIGSGVVDQLPGVRGFVNNSSPLHTKSPVKRQVRPNMDNKTGREVMNFANLKAQCAWKLAELVETHKIAVKGAEIDEQEMLVEEMVTIKQKDPDKEQKLRLIPKEEIKESLGRSPDGSDTFIFRMFFEILRDTSTLVPPTKKGLQHSGSTRRLESPAI